MISLLFFRSSCIPLSALGRKRGESCPDYLKGYHKVLYDTIGLSAFKVQESVKYIVVYCTAVTCTIRPADVTLGDW